MLQINRYVEGDAWVVGELLRALGACARSPRDGRRARPRPADPRRRGDDCRAGRRQVGNERDRRRINALLEELGIAPIT